MKLALIKGHLKDAVAAVVGATTENQNLPILKNILIEAVGGAVTLTATNLEIAIRATLPGKVMEEGSVTVPATTLLQMVNNLTSERIGIDVKDNVLSVTTDAYSATIQGVSPEDFPIIPSIKEERGNLKIKGILIKDALSQVVVASQPSELRPELASILFFFALESLKLVATDSFRLAEKTIVKTQFSTTYKESFKLLLPLKTAQELIRLLSDDEDVTFRDDGSQIIFETPTRFLVSRLIDGNFPDYGAIVPKDFSTRIVLETAEFASAIKLASVFGSRVSELKIEALENKKSVQVSSAEQGLGENTSVLAAKIDGDAKSASFNWRYLQDGVKAVHGKDLFIGLNQEESRAALLRAPNDASYFYIVMPIMKG
jgi:DNA polymerase III subunit beta